MVKTKLTKAKATKLRTVHIAQARLHIPKPFDRFCTDRNDICMGKS